MIINPLKIGHLTINPPVMLAPMAGYTTPPFRNICRKFGSGLNFTEMVPAEGIRRGLRQTMVYLDSLPEERPLAAHIYGSNPEAFADAARIIEDLGRFDLVDINCGCPVRKIAGRGAGVALMREPGKIGDIVRATVEATSLPVTVKTRIGSSPGFLNISEVAQMVESNGASALTIHARFGTQRHSGPVHLETLRRVKSEISIPVIGNGGIRNDRQALDMTVFTDIDGVMIGQGAIGNPWVFRQIGCAFIDRKYHPPSVVERMEVISEHLYGLHELMKTKNLLRKHPISNVEKLTCEAFRGHLKKYLKGVRGIKNLQLNLTELQTIEAVIESVWQILNMSNENA